MIDGVELKHLQTHPDERGFFRELVRVTDEFFSEGFGQWSHSAMHQGVVKAWHIHRHQVDWWYIPIGVVKAVVCDLRGADPGQSFTDKVKADFPVWRYPIQEFILGDGQPPAVLRIPPGVAHGCKVLQGPAHLFYITSRTYDPADEGRIPYDALGYDWLRGPEIK